MPFNPINNPINEVFLRNINNLHIAVLSQGTTLIIVAGWLNNSIWHRGEILTSTITSGQSGPWSNCYKGVLYIPHIPRTGAAPSDSFIRRTLIGRSYLSAEVQLVFSNPIRLIVSDRMWKKALARCSYHYLLLNFIYTTQLPSRLELQNTPNASLQRRKTPSTSFLVMTLNKLMESLLYCWSFGECGVPSTALAHWSKQKFKFLSATSPICLDGYYKSGPKWTWDHWRGTPHFPKLLELEPYHQMQFSLIPFVVRALPHPASTGDTVGVFQARRQGL